MLKAIALHLMLAFFMASQPVGNVYSAWTEDGMHLMISDNGTPEDLEDDFICDWEDNRVFTITIED